MADTVAFLGGVSRWRELRVVHPARLIRRSVETGFVVRVTKGRYVLPTTAEQLATAQSRSAVLSHLSAAVHHGWKVKRCRMPRGSPSLGTADCGRASVSV